MTQDRLDMRIPASVKSNTRNLINDLYDLGLRGDKNLTAYTIEAIKEKRERDLERIEKARIRLRDLPKGYVQN